MEQLHIQHFVVFGTDNLHLEKNGNNAISNEKTVEANNVSSSEKSSQNREKNEDPPKKIQNVENIQKKE